MTITVTDEAGFAMTGFRVWANGTHRMTDASGEFWLPVDESDAEFVVQDEPAQLCPTSLLTRVHSAERATLRVQRPSWCATSLADRRLP